jgi:iron-sulfur cluster repair protein YtfE (RIC family)
LLVKPTVPTALVSIGRQAQEPGDLVDLFLACHQRIRRFIRLAEHVAVRDDLPAAEVTDGCLRVERYFVEALPLHVEDEEASVVPRLRGQQREVDDALRAMEDEHREHQPLLASLLEASRAVREAPLDHARRAPLASIAARLTGDFERHLVLEETIIFPAVRALSAAARAEILAELRARREAG